MIPARGFVSEDTIPITIDIVNESNVRIENIKVMLEKSEYFIAYMPGLVVKTRKHIMAESSMGGIDAHTSHQIRHLFELPPLIPSSAFPNIVYWNYKLKVLTHLMSKVFFSFSSFM